VRYLERAVAERAAQPTEQRELLLELGRWQRITGDDAALATLERALEQSAGTPAHVRAAIELAATAYSRADNRLVEQTVRAVAGVEMTPDERLIVDMLHAEALWGELQLDASLRMIDRVPSDLPGDTPAQRMALGMAGAARLLRGAPIDEATDMLRRSVGEDGTAPGPVAGLDLGDPLQWIIQAGELDEAQALAEERMRTPARPATRRCSLRRRTRWAGCSRCAGTCAAPRPPTGSGSAIPPRRASCARTWSSTSWRR
jgi:hypothetical protein